jgi:tetratricopeptide (TPR) repeat protein
VTRLFPARWVPCLTAATLLIAGPATGAQDSPSAPQESSSKQHDPDSRYKKPASAPPADPAFDPLRAEKDIEVGTYYMHKGNLDAAMDRFTDATKAQPKYALPYRLLGEAQEKKGLKTEAIKSYTRYLELYPHAEDAEKVRRRIQKLQEAADKSSHESR